MPRRKLSGCCVHISRRTVLPGWVGCAPSGVQAALALVEPGAKGDGSAARPRVAWVAREDWQDPAAALRRLKRSRALHRRRSVAVLGHAQYQMVTLDAPDTPREEWRAATRWRLKDLVDFPVDAASIDILEIPAAPGARRQPQLIAVAAPHAQLRPLMQAAHEAGTGFAAIDVPETALRNLSACVEPEGRAQALLHFDDVQGLMVITHGGELLASRHLGATLAQITDADDGARQAAWDRIGLELQRTLDGFERQFSHLALARLLVTPAPGVHAFATHVGELLYAPVQLLALDEALDFSAVPELADAATRHHYLCAIGAALRGD